MIAIATAIGSGFILGAATVVGLIIIAACAIWKDIR